ncbi:MAG: type II toxin-antitoxin system HicA family toxin [SAR324 cluster bacterium]|nr:type II toxin-antitoxin system HicA family toxin [SAR324 cluster bacterium]
MGKLNNISGKDAAKAFSKSGWSKAGQVGSHLIMTKTGEKANLSIPQHKELSVGTLRSLIRHSSLSVDAFLKLFILHNRIIYGTEN